MLFLILLSIINPIDELLINSCEEIDEYTSLTEYCFDYIFEESESKLPRHEVKRITWCESSWKTGAFNPHSDASGIAQIRWSSVEVFLSRVGFKQKDVFDPIKAIQMMPYIQRTSVYIYYTDTEIEDYWENYWDYVLSDDLSYLTDETPKWVYWSRWDCNNELRYSYNRWEIYNPRRLNPYWLNYYYLYEQKELINKLVH